MTTDATGETKPRLEARLSCRQARKQIRAHTPVRPLETSSHQASGEVDDSALRAHLARCTKCEAEARINRFYRMMLTGDGAAAGAEVPDEAWLRGLRARIEREGSPTAAASEDSFAGIVSIVARQMVPVMLGLVLLIVGATLFWKAAPVTFSGANDPVMMNQIIEYPQPTADDVLGNLLAVEDKKNGK